MVDWLMGLNFLWYSTMWGVYIFAGSAGAGMSLLVIIVTVLRSQGYLKPVISYATNNVATYTIPASGTVRLGGVATVYTTEDHRFRPGAQITVAGVSDASFDGTFAISAALSPTQFSYVQAGPDAVSGNGTASSQDLGGCVTGGTFWDSSAVPAAYRGNFFFGD